MIHAHTVGNATATSLLTATAAYLGLEVEHVTHTEERWWHLATCRDRIRLVPAPGGRHRAPGRPGRAGGEPVPQRGHRADPEEARPDLPGRPRWHRRRHRDGAGPGGRFPDRAADGRGVPCRSRRGLRGVRRRGLRSCASSRRVAPPSTVAMSPAPRGRSVAPSSVPLRARSSSHDFVLAGDPDDGDRQADLRQDHAAGRRLRGLRAAFPHGAPTLEPIGLPRGLSKWVGFVRAAHTSGPDRRAPRDEARPVRLRRVRRGRRTRGGHGRATRP